MLWKKLDKRTWIKDFLADVSDPTTAFDNWTSKDVIFAKEVARQALYFGYTSIVVGGGKSILQNFEMVEKAFSLA